MRSIKALFISIVLLPFSLAARADDVPDAKTELNAAIDLLKARHMNSGKVDWPVVQAKALAMLGDALKPEGAYPAIWYVIDQLGEKHTYLRTADEAKALMTGSRVGNVQPPDWQMPAGHLLDGGIGVLELKAVMGRPPPSLLTQMPRGPRCALSPTARLAVTSSICGPMGAAACIP